MIVACDGSPDDTPQRAREAGADLVLELPRGGKVRAQDAAVAGGRSAQHVIAFSDANSSGSRTRCARWSRRCDDEDVGYVCGQVRFVNAQAAPTRRACTGATRCGCASRESRLASVTGGNGAIYAVRREAYLDVDPVMGHDLSFPFNFVKRGRRAVYAPAARATEKMVPSIEGEFARKRRMMSHAWPIVLRGGMLSPRGYPPLYALMIVSHRVLRYAAPVLHVVALVDERRAARGGPRLRRRARRPGRRARRRGARRACPLAPLLVARYYVLTNASVAAGLYDHLRHGTPAGWAPPEGTR